MIAGLLLGLALAAPPDALRDDGAVVFGCPSRAALDISVASLPTAVGKQLTDSVGMLSNFGADEDKPFWLVLKDINGQLLPVQLVFHVPEGVKPPTMLLRMLPGSPRVAQAGTELSVTMGGPPSAEASGALALVRRVGEAKDGCALGAIKLGDAVPFTVGLGTSTTGEASLLLDAPESDQAMILGLVGGVPPGIGTSLFQAVRSPQEAPRPGWAATAEPPPMAVRLNNDVPVLPLVESLYADPAQVPKFARKVVVEPGAELTFRRVDGKIQDWALVAPIDKPRPVCMWPGRIAASARKSGLEVKKFGRVFGVPQGDGTLWITAKRRRFIAASSREAAEALRDPDVGTGWFTESLVDDPDAPGALVRVPMGGGIAVGRVLPEDGDWIRFDYRLVSP